MYSISRFNKVRINMNVSEMCKDYFNGFQDVTTSSDTTTNVLGALKIISYFTVIIPLIFGAIYATSLCGRVSQPECLSATAQRTTDLGTRMVTSKENGAIPRPYASQPSSAADHLDGATSGAAELAESPAEAAKAARLSEIQGCLAIVIQLYENAKHLAADSITAFARRDSDTAYANLDQLTNSRARLHDQMRLAHQFVTQDTNDENVQAVYKQMDGYAVELDACFEKVQAAARLDAIQSKIKIVTPIFQEAHDLVTVTLRALEEGQKRTATANLEELKLKREAIHKELLDVQDIVDEAEIKNDEDRSAKGKTLSDLIQALKRLTFDLMAIEVKLTPSS